MIVNQQTTKQGIWICAEQQIVVVWCRSEMMICPLVFVSEDLTSSIMAARPSMALALGQQQVAGLARAATLEQLREKLETSGGEGPERKMARLAEEQQRLMQQAFQHNLLAMASQMPMNLRLGAPTISTRGQCCQKASIPQLLSVGAVSTRRVPLFHCLWRQNQTSCIFSEQHWAHSWMLHHVWSHSLEEYTRLAWAFNTIGTYGLKVLK